MPQINEVITKVCANEKCGKEFEDVWGTMKYCSTTCKDRQKWLERSRKKNTRGGYNRKTYITLWLKAKGHDLGPAPCHYCGSDVMIDNFVIDHVVPQSQLKTRAEKLAIENLVISCKSCNSKKASMPAQLFIQWIEYEKAEKEREEEGCMGPGHGESTLQPGRELEVETNEESTMEADRCIHCESGHGPVPEEG